MNFAEFEPTNGNKLSRKMFGASPRRPKIRMVRRPVEIRLSSVDGEDETETNYPVDMNKKIFGMTPKTLAIALGVIVIGVLAINLIGVNNQPIAGAAPAQPQPQV